MVYKLYLRESIWYLFLIHKKSISSDASQSLVLTIKVLDIVLKIGQDKLKRKYTGIFRFILQKPDVWKLRYKREWGANIVETTVDPHKAAPLIRCPLTNSGLKAMLARLSLDLGACVTSSGSEGISVSSSFELRGIWRTRKQC